MTGKELVLEAYVRAEQERPPWVPFTGVHAGALAGYTASEYLLDANKIVTGVQAAYDLYRPDGLPVLFDLQLEAEVLGARLQWADDAPPSVASHPLEQGYEGLTQLHMPAENEGRIPLAIAATRALHKSIGQHIALYGLVTGPFTLASHMRGVNIFLDMFDAPDQLLKLMNFCGQVARRMADYYMAAGADIIAVVDPMISQISPEHFRQYVHDEALATFSHIRSAGRLSSYFVCGNATSILAEMAASQPDGIAVDENVDMSVAKKVAAQFGISYAGNIPLTTTMLFGSEVENMSTVLDLVEKNAGPGYILSPGCDIPYAVPVSNIGALTMAIHKPEEARVIVANQQSSSSEKVNVTLPNYNQLKRPLVEVITIDSDTCPPCKYMVEATRQVAKMIPGGIDWQEHKITTPENVARMRLLGVKNLPTIVINGKVAFISRIPDLDTYSQAILKKGDT